MYSLKLTVNIQVRSNILLGHEFVNTDTNNSDSQIEPHSGSDLPIIVSPALVHTRFTVYVTING